MRSASSDPPIPQPSQTLVVADDISGALANWSFLFSDLLAALSDGDRDDVPFLLLNESDSIKSLPTFASFVIVVQIGNAIQYNLSLGTNLPIAPMSDMDARASLDPTMNTFISAVV